MTEGSKWDKKLFQQNHFILDKNVGGRGYNIKDIYKYVKYYTVEEERKVMAEELGAIIIEASNE